MSAPMILLTKNALVYEGPSLLTGDPIVCIVGARTSNPKTGPMAQTWILGRDQDPVSAVKEGHDSAICGNCWHRGGDGRKRTCYVNVGQAPLGIWRARESAVREDPAAVGLRLAGKAIRLGAYGDPAAVPTQVWRDLTAHVEVSTGYTHQWRTCDPDLRQLCMASVESIEEAAEAHAMGWRTFRVRRPEGHLTGGEISCVNETHPDITCVECGLCQGQSRPAANIVIEAHGARKWSFEDADHR